MKKFNFRINGNEYQTTVEQSGELLQVTFNGKSFTAELEKEDTSDKLMGNTQKV